MLETFRDPRYAVRAWSSEPMARVVVIGAGAMGLAAAYRALTLGHHVTVLEAAPEAGGMAAHFDLDGLSIERFYHFVCKSDAPTFDAAGGAGHRRPDALARYLDGLFHRRRAASVGRPVVAAAFSALVAGREVALRRC